MAHETPETVLAREALARIGHQLAVAFDELAAEFRRNQQAHKEAMQVAALFVLYRELRQLPNRSLHAEVRAAREKEIRAQLDAAIVGYDVVYLADLSTFGGWLADAAGKEWRSRT